ncbi:hypothetical protein [Prescottella equi]
MDISAFASVIGALGLGSFVGQYLIGAQGRRQARSEVLLRLAECEAARWAGPNEEADIPPFRQAIRQFEKAALVAGTPRSIVEHYQQLAFVAMWSSELEADSDPNAYDLGRIDDNLADLVRKSALDLSRVVWHPWVHRVGMRRRIKRRREAVTEINGALMRNAVAYVGGKPLPPLPPPPVPPLLPPPPAFTPGVAQSDSSST